MVMATGSVCHPPAGELSHEAGEASDDASEAAALHERLVAYVHALAGGPEPRSGVWGEHSYARARGAAAAHVRVLLAPRAPPDAAPDAALDVTALEPAPPPPPGAEPEPGDDSEPDDDWEARVEALAPGAAHARLAAAALDALRRMRLERLAACPEAARAAARRLRRALVAAGPGAGAWLHATLPGLLPRGPRRLYEEAVRELRRAAPRLAARALGSAEAGPAGRAEPLRAVGAAGPWLVWLGCGRARADARWTRRLGALLHVRELAVGGGAGRAAPDAWCAAAAGSARAALADVLQEAGSRGVVLGGAGAGAALCTALAGGAAARLRGLLLLAPPLLTAEGPRDAPDDPLAALRLPVLLVLGSRAAGAWRGAARAAARGEARRLLELRGADDALRLPAALRRRRRLPQHALDAAVADECARWALETALGAPARSPPRRRDLRDRLDDDEEYAHLPSGAPPATPAEPAAPAAGGAAGRVVSRGPASTPLPLAPPRRAAAALAAADILRLPIVFADDDALAEPPAASPVTVTAGRAHPYTRVIVASRAPPRTRPAAPPGPAPPGPVLLRRGLRLLPRAERPH